MVTATQATAMFAVMPTAQRRILPTVISSLGSMSFLAAIKTGWSFPVAAGRTRLDTHVLIQVRKRSTLCGNEQYQALNQSG
jgi:hypothetical protein